MLLTCQIDTRKHMLSRLVGRLVGYSVTAPAHLHATKVAVYPAFFLIYYPAHFIYTLKVSRDKVVCSGVKGESNARTEPEVPAQTET